MAIKNLATITCSLNLGLIYSINYEYSPQGGVTIHLFFANQNSIYSRPQYMEKAQIRIGSASFSMYVVASDIQLDQGRRVMEVVFMDDTFMLENYWVVLTGKGCGYNVYELGSPVDSRTLEEKQAAALDSDAQQIIEFTQFPDIEYSFDEFILTLRKKFSVQINAFYDTDITNSFCGTFREVLDSWCSLFNLSWYFENSIIKIFDPTKLTINLPSQPTDAISFNSLEDARDTYGKTCFNWFQQEGGQYSLNQTSDDDGALLVRTDTLFPIGYEFGLPQAAVDLNQVAAAQFGQPFWFLYNYWLGSTATNCGWTPINPSNTLSVVNSVQNAGCRIASVNEPVFEQRYDAFKTYGEGIAGRWYLSRERNELATDQNYQWFDESNGQIFTFTNVDDKALNLEFLTPTNAGVNVIPGTAINAYFSGVNYVGNRIAYRDDSLPSSSPVLTATQQALVNSTYESIYALPGSESLDFNSQLQPVYGTDNTYVGYNPITIPQDLVTIFDNIPAMAESYLPRFDSFPIKGITRQDYSTLKASQSEQEGVDIVNEEGPTVVSNTAVIKTLKEGAYTVYYNKYAKCASAYSAGPYFGHRFEPRQISCDNAIGITFSKSAANVYNLTRDYGLVNSLVDNPMLPQMAQGRTFLTKRVSFVVNYFYDVPTAFLTNGLVGLNMRIDDNGVRASYSYSNEVLEVPSAENQFARFEQMIRNSWIRQYHPNQVIS